MNHAQHQMPAAAPAGHMAEVAHPPGTADHAMATHSMEGIPTWMAIGGLALIIIFSHLLLRQRRRTPAHEKLYRRFGLLDLGLLKSLVKTSFFPILIQSLSIALLLLIVAAGLFGSQRSNIATVLTWTWWWALLIFVIVCLGKSFCAICPWEGLASLTTSLSLRSRIKKIGFELKWPRWGRNLYPALALFILLTWFELGYKVTYSASLTAIMGMLMVGMAVLSAMTFEKRAFCRYACLVGRVSGIYALFSPVELRPESKSTCRSCETVDCVKGNESHTGCPTSLFPGNLQENTYCTLCTECIRACPHDNLNLNIRPFAADLMKDKKFRWDEAIMAMVLLALTSFHGVTMTPQWSRVNDYLRAWTGLGDLVVFTVLMAVILALPLLLFLGGAALSRALANKTAPGRRQILKAFAYAIIPVALFYHLAHNGMHFFMEAQKIVPLLSDPFGYGWNLFGTAGREYAPLLSLQTIWWIQIVFIIIGHVYGVLIADRVGYSLFGESGNGMKGLIPFIITMVLYSGFSIWLISQPMEMRSGM